MQTLSYGYQKPETGDRGAALFTALEQNIQRVNDHTHNGTDSAPLPAQSISAVSDPLSSSNWVAFGPTGFYRMLVTMPAGFDFDEVQIGFRVSGIQAFMEVAKISDTQYYLYSNDNTISPIAIYGG